MGTMYMAQLGTDVRTFRQRVRAWDARTFVSFVFVDGLMAHTPMDSGYDTWPLHFSSFLLSFVVSIAFLIHIPLWSDDDSDVMVFFRCLFISLEDESS